MINYISLPWKQTETFNLKKDILWLQLNSSILYIHMFVYRAKYPINWNQTEIFNHKTDILWLLLNTSILYIHMYVYRAKYPINSNKIKCLNYFGIWRITHIDISGPKRKNDLCMCISKILRWASLGCVFYVKFRHLISEVKTIWGKTL